MIDPMSPIEENGEPGRLPNLAERRLSDLNLAEDSALTCAIQRVIDDLETPQQYAAFGNSP